eukprot:TRINITY_DN11118_c0_g1_i1.p1 TRINITY_DN11118_c0_g1~~TRINITY_DN11118_c0_g1_i1.p1  ORF type:complete len:161 (+),score=7.06 TRINITY_DN11118_c0_g1_i1:55-483(+)
MIRRSVGLLKAAPGLHPRAVGEMAGYETAGGQNRFTHPYIVNKGNDIAYEGKLRVGSTLGMKYKSSGQRKAVLQAESTITEQDRLWADENRRRYEEQLSQMSIFQRMWTQWFNKNNSPWGYLKDSPRDVTHHSYSDQPEQKK